MPKGLRLKKTPAEQLEHDMRRARKAAKKAAHRQYRPHDADFDADGRSSKRSRTQGDEDVDLEPPFLDPGPSTRYGAHTAPVAEESFQEKLWDALRDDERLDGVEAQLNEYAYIPRRWRGVSSRAYSPDTIGGLGDDPNLMNDDEYAEWMRSGMWRYVLTVLPNAVHEAITEFEKHLTLDRKRNAAAHREKERQRAALAAAKAEEEDARRRARHERKRRRHADARDTHEERWAGLLGSKSAELRFGDIPWPVQGEASNISQITAEAVSAFLFFHVEGGLDNKAGTLAGRTRKEELRGTMLRFHPDKFEGRVIPRVKDAEKAAVREGANAVTRAVTALMGRSDRGDIT
jgi:hypothetical protein